MSHQVPDPVKTTRSAELLAMEKEQSKQFRTHYVGREAEVLLEETKEIGGTEYLFGTYKRLCQTGCLCEGK